MMTRFCRQVPLAVLVTVVMALAGLRPAEAQEPEACAGTESARLRVTLPRNVLEWVDAHSQSVFVQSFLISYIAMNGAPDHWLTRCATRFDTTELTDVASLSRYRLSTETMIRALRREDSVDVEERRIRDRVRQLRQLAGDVLSDTSVVRIAAAMPFFDETRAHCGPAASSGCEALEALDTAWRSVGNLEHEIDTLKALQETLKGQLVATNSEVEAVTEKIWGDTSVRAAARQAEQAAKLAEADSAAGRSEAAAFAATAAALNAAADERGSAQKALKNRAQSLDDRLNAAGAARDSAARALIMARQQLARRLEKVQATFDENTPIAKVPDKVPSTTNAAARLDLAVDPPANRSTAPTAATPNLTVALTEFVIDRAKQEVVLAYIAKLYGWMRRDSLLQVSFPETYALMRDLGQTQSADDFGLVMASRVSLDTWRSTLATDFERWPINVMAASPFALCDTVKACSAQTRQLAPFVASARRLLDGDDVFDVLEDVQTTAISVWGLDTAYARLRQGLAVVSAIAEAYHVQGKVESADPMRFPYVISHRALAQLPRAQRDALARLLVLRAFDVDKRTPDKHLKSAGQLVEVVDRAVRDFEAIGAVAETGELTPARSARVLALGLDGMNSATDVAALFANTTKAKTITEVGASAANLAAALEPLVTREYALAASRAAIFLTEVRTISIPRDELALLSMGAMLAEAQNADQVRSAFEAAASPVGGWRAKRYHQGPRATLTAMPGLAGGWESLFGRQVASSPAWWAGLSVPLGFEYQLTGRSDDPRKVPSCWPGSVFCSAGVYVPLFDLGPVLSMRLGGSAQVEDKADFSLLQVVAPGLMLNLGIAHSPLVVGFGAELAPALRSEVVNGDRLSANAVRLGLALGVDTELFEF